MRLYDIIFEDRITNTIQQRADKVGQAALRDATVDVDQDLEAEQVGIKVIKHIFNQIAPMNNQKYADWLARRYADTQIQYEDLYKYTEFFNMFHQHKQQFERKDINQYKNASEFEEVVFILKDRLEAGEVEVSTKAGMRKAKREYADNIDVIYEDDEWNIIVPKTIDACRAAGTRTNWCTATTSTATHAKRYLAEGKLYIWQSLHNEEDKFQLYLSAKSKNMSPMSLKELHPPEFRNRTDATIGAQDVKRLPKVEELVVNHYGTGLGEIIYAKMTGEPIPSDFENKINGDPKLALLYLGILTENDGDPAQIKAAKQKYEPLFASNAGTAVKYADKVLNGRFPAGEAIIATDAEASYQYASRQLKDRFPAGEAIIAMDPGVAVQYARHVIGGRFPEGEDAIATDPLNAERYVDNVIKGPFPKFEHILADDATTAKSYAIRHLGGERFPQGEPKILKTANETAIEYAAATMPNGWPELENSILQKGDPSTALSYLLEYPDIDWPAGVELVESSEAEAIIYREIMADPDLRAVFFG